MFYTEQMSDWKQQYCKGEGQLTKKSNLLLSLNMGAIDTVVSVSYFWLS